MAGRGATSDATPKYAVAAVAGGGMGREKGTGRGSSASGKTRKAIPLEWENERGGQDLQSGGKPRGGTPGSGRGGRISKSHQHPYSGRFSLG